MVVAIIAVIGAIAIPRMSASAAGAGDAAMLKDWRELQTSGELFSAEHLGIGIGVDRSGSAVTSPAVLKRLLLETDIDGGTSGATIFGPYLHKMPTNRENSLNTLRVDGPDAGAGTHGWRLDSASGVFSPDTDDGIVIIKTLGGAKLDLGGVKNIVVP